MSEQFHAKGLDIPGESLKMVHRFLSLWENVKRFQGRSDVLYISPMELDRARVRLDSLPAKSARSKAEAATFSLHYFNVVRHRSLFLRRFVSQPTFEVSRNGPGSVFRRKRSFWILGGQEKSGAPECATVKHELVRPRLLLQEESKG